MTGTLSKAKDNASNDDGFSSQDPLDPNDTWGLADSDQRHRLVTSFVWELPSPQTGAAKAVLGGWQFNGILKLASGTPFTVSSGRDTMLNFATSRANLIGDPNLPTNRSRAELIPRYFNAGAFEIPATGTFGNTPRNFLIGPGSKNVDLSLFRTFEVRDRLRLQFRAEAFNAFNFVNLGNGQDSRVVFIDHRRRQLDLGIFKDRSPDCLSHLSGSGRIDTAGAARVMQFGLRLTF